MIRYDELTDVDFKLLKYLYDAIPNYVELESLLSKFNDRESTMLRIDLLSMPDCSEYGFPISNTSYIAYKYETYEDELGATQYNQLNSIKITTLGRKAYVDYLSVKNKESKNKLEERLWKSISLIALLISILSFLQSIHVIDLTKYGNI
ncbi:hypothetical protein [Veillonella sp.]|uniref:hypothetical protein n=1 Tax=Veillonella sp. TaxID=1926307 RepID=UPI00242A3AC8|nr:hypothetical protein [Veillonella sp.]